MNRLIIKKLILKIKGIINKFFFLFLYGNKFIWKIITKLISLILKIQYLSTFHYFLFLFIIFSIFYIFFSLLWFFFPEIKIVFGNYLFNLIETNFYVTEFYVGLKYHYYIRYIEEEDLLYIFPVIEEGIYPVKRKKTIAELILWIIFGVHKFEEIFKIFYKFFFENFFFLFFFLFLSFFFYILFKYKNYDIKNLRYKSIIFSNMIFFFFFLIYCSSLNQKFSYIFLFHNINLNLINLNFNFGLDNLSISFILLTSFLFNISLLVSLYNIKYRFKLFILNFFFLELLIILAFLSINLFLFYIFFELSLMPMFLLIGIWGSRQRKIYAVYQFFYYTLFGSIFLLIAIFILYSNFYTLDIQILMNTFISYEKQLLIWFFLFLGFSTKIPLVPFHGWLPEAHVEAPTAGSVILAGILLKLGTYGLLRFLLPICFFANYFYLIYVYTLCLISIMYISIIILVQLDLKKIIAYSSILHMNFIILGLFSFTITGLTGSIFLMFSHALISSGFFICIGILYDRYKTRNLIYYSGLVETMPLFSTFFFILVLSNMSFPLTSNFIGELLVCLGLVANNYFLIFFIILFTFFNSVYSIWLFNRIIFGKNKFIKQVSDISEREFFILFSIIFWIFLLGIKPNLLIDFIKNYIYWILEYINY